MKKSLVILAVLTVSLAVVGVAFAADAGPCPPGFKSEYKLDKGKPTLPKCVTVPCKQMVTIPGKPYTMLEKKGPDKIVMVEKDVMHDLCAGKAKGKCNLCGPCSPTITWDCKWKTSMICGTVKVPTKVPTKVKYPQVVKCVPVPCPPPDCF
jgi:hypothetical protein